jgi:amino acid transporter
MTAAQQVRSWFQGYMAAPVVIAFYVGYKFWYRTAVVRSYNMDLHTGIRELNVAELIEEEKAERREWPRWKRVFKFFC